MGLDTPTLLIDHVDIPKDIAKAYQMLELKESFPLYDVSEVHNHAGGRVVQALINQGINRIFRTGAT